MQAAVTPAMTLSDPDRACAKCHAAIYASYEQTSMARGSGLAAEEVHAGSFRSAKSGVSYRVQQRDGQVLLTSERESAEASLRDVETLQYFIGSGKHGRTYLFARKLPGSTDGTITPSTLQVLAAVDACPSQDSTRLFTVADVSLTAAQARECFRRYFARYHQHLPSLFHRGN